VAGRGEAFPEHSGQGEEVLNHIAFILWSVPALAFSAALTLMVRQARRSVSGEPAIAPAAAKGEERNAPATAELRPSSREAGAPARPSQAAKIQPGLPQPATESPIGDAVLWLEGFESLGREFHIREVSLLVSRRPDGLPGKQRPRIIVDFAPGASVNYSVYLKLREKIAGILGHETDVVCKQIGKNAPPMDRSMVEHRLYAA
jgi:hypothetical protein